MTATRLGRGGAVLAVLLVAAAGVAAAVYFLQFRPDRLTDEDAGRAAITAAAEGTVAILSYAPETLDRDFASAKSHLTGDFLSSYSQFLDEVVAPSAKSKSLTKTANVVRAAVSRLDPSAAVVLVFFNQITSTPDDPEPAVSASSVLVKLAKVDGSWMISAFDPV